MSQNFDLNSPIDCEEMRYKAEQIIGKLNPAVEIEGVAVFNNIGSALFWLIKKGELFEEAILDNSGDCFIKTSISVYKLIAQKNKQYVYNPDTDMLNQRGEIKVIAIEKELAINFNGRMLETLMINQAIDSILGFRETTIEKKIARTVKRYWKDYKSFHVEQDTLGKIYILVVETPEKIYRLKGPKIEG